MNKFHDVVFNTDVFIDYIPPLMLSQDVWFISIGTDNSVSRIFQRRDARVFYHVLS